MDDYNAILNFSKKFYFDLKPITCKILQGRKVHFTNSGFTHILRKGRKSRPIPDQIKRFKLLPYVFHIVKKADQIYEIRQKKGVTYWSIGLRESPKVVVCSNTRGPLYFVSILP